VENVEKSIFIIYNSKSLMENSVDKTVDKNILGKSLFFLKQLV
jgi:hypothetical protein